MKKKINITHIYYIITCLIIIYMFWQLGTIAKELSTISVENVPVKDRVVYFITTGVPYLINASLTYAAGFIIKEISSMKKELSEKGTGKKATQKKKTSSKKTAPKKESTE